MSPKSPAEPEATRSTLNTSICIASAATWLQPRRVWHPMSRLAAFCKSETMSAAAVLGALQNQFHRLQESARGISIPDNLKHNISANLGNVRDFVGDFVPAARGTNASDHAASAAGGAPGASAADAGAGFSANQAAHSDQIASSSGPPAGAAASQHASSAPVALHADHEGASMRTADAAEPAELDADPDLEAYLKVRKKTNPAGVITLSGNGVKHALVHLPSALSLPLCTTSLRQQHLSLVAGDGEQRPW